MYEEFDFLLFCVVFNFTLSLGTPHRDLIRSSLYFQFVVSFKRFLVKIFKFCVGVELEYNLFGNTFFFAC